MTNSTKGFTIVELLIVIVVIAILAAITIVTYTGIQGRARDSQRLQDMKTIVKALEIYKTKVGSYPVAVGNSNASGWEVSHDGTNPTNFLAALKTSDTVSTVPLDPKNFADASSGLGSLNPTNATSNYVYFYHRYTAGSGSCDTTGGAFYVLGVTRMDTVNSGAPHSTSPGFSCPGRNWANNGAWVTGGYTN